MIITTGAILRFKLDFDLGYGFGVVEDHSKKNLIIKLKVEVKNLIINEKDVFSLDHFEKADNLLNPIMINEYPNLRGKRCWKLVGEIKDYKRGEIPIFKVCPLMNQTHYNESEFGPWRVENHKSEDFFEYNRIGHLERNYIFSKEEVVKRTTMELLKLKTRKIENFYDIKDLKYRWTYLRSINVPFQKDIPDKYKGEIIPKEDLEQFDGIPFRSSQANPNPPDGFPENPLHLGG